MVDPVILEGDCVDLMKTLPAESIDVIFADPPYNTGNTKSKVATYDQNENLARKSWTNFHADWDVIDDNYAFSLAWLEQCRTILKPSGSIWVCGSFHSIPDVARALKTLGFYTIQWVAWCIPNAMPHLAQQRMASSNQTIIWARKSEKVRHFYDHVASKTYNDGKNLRDYWIINNDSQAGKLWKHPSKKPTKLVERAVAISLPDDKETSVVLDPFAGSGTTGVACGTVGVPCLLIEKEPEYVTMMRKRLLSMEG